MEACSHMLSFPESNCSEGDWEHVFFYRFRRNSDVYPVNSESAESQEYLFGYTYYMQRKDEMQPRGYIQKSFVIITPFYFSCFFMKLVQLIGRAYFSSIKLGFLRVSSLNHLGII